MNKTEKRAKIDNKIMGILKVDYIEHPICHTSKGGLTIRLNKESSDYRFTLDAVPFLDKVNKELMNAFDGLLDIFE